MMLALNWCMKKKNVLPPEKEGTVLFSFILTTLSFLSFFSPFFLFSLALCTRCVGERRLRKRKRKKKKEKDGHPPKKNYQIFFFKSDNDEGHCAKERVRERREGREQFSISSVKLLSLFPFVTQPFFSQKPTHTHPTTPAQKHPLFLLFFFLSPSFPLSLFPLTREEEGGEGRKEGERRRRKGGEGRGEGGGRGRGVKERAAF